MNLSQNTITALKHLAQVNQEIGVLTPGNVLATRTEAVLAEATVEENFPVDFIIPDVHEFVRIVKLFQNPILTFESGIVRVTASNSEAEAVYSPNSKQFGLDLPIMNKKKRMPSEQAAFGLTAGQWRMLQKALSGGSGVRRLVIAGDGAGVVVGVHAGFRMERQELALRLNSKEPIGEFKLVYNAEHLRMAAGAYDITVTPSYAIFNNVSGCGLRYYVGSETHLSSWGGKQAYQIQVTKASTQVCHVTVQAHTPAEAEAMVRGMPVDGLGSTGDPRFSTEYKVLPR